MITILTCRNPDSLEDAIEILFKSSYAYYDNKTVNTSNSNNTNNRTKTDNNINGHNNFNNRQVYHNSHANTRTNNYQHYTSTYHHIINRTLTITVKIIREILITRTCNNDNRTSTKMHNRIKQITIYAFLNRWM